MIERYVHAVRTEDPGREEPAATRERLRDLFPRGTSRRMTQLGLLLGSVLGPIQLDEDDTLIYASTYAEGRALEDYLAGFPTPSPTLFQTSIHPSAVQQVLIARQQAVRQFIPLSGRRQLPVDALQTALLADTARVVVCGGEERGGRLRDQGVTSELTFAFAFELSLDPAGAIGTLRLGQDPGGSESELTLPLLFMALHSRRPVLRRLGRDTALVLSWA